VSQQVLVVDDDRDIRETVSQILSDEGLSVATARDGREALDWLRNWLQSHPTEACVVVLDLMMPVMDGFQFLKAKQADPALANAPVVVLTASTATNRVRVQADVRACLRKPVSIEALCGAVEDCCRALTTE
jgi:CheY-like chemotaxis protein